MPQPQYNEFGIKPLNPNPEDEFGIKPLLQEPEQQSSNPFTWPNAVRIVGSSAGDLLGGALAPFTGGLSYPALSFGGGAAAEGVARWMEGQPFNPAIMGIEGTLNLVPGPNIPGKGAALKEIGKYAVKSGVYGGAQGALGAAPRHMAEEGIYDEQGKLNLPSAGEVAGQTAAGTVFGTAFGSAIGAGRLGLDKIADVRNPAISGNWDVVGGGTSGPHGPGRTQPPIVDVTPPIEDPSRMLPPPAGGQAPPPPPATPPSGGMPGVIFSADGNTATITHPTAATVEALKNQGFIPTPSQSGFVQMTRTQPAAPAQPAGPITPTGGSRFGDHIALDEDTLIVSNDDGRVNQGYIQSMEEGGYTLDNMIGNMAIFKKRQMAAPEGGGPPDNILEFKDPRVSQFKGALKTRTTSQLQQMLQDAEHDSAALPSDSPHQADFDNEIAWIREELQSRTPEQQLGEFVGGITRPQIPPPPEANPFGPTHQGGPYGSKENPSGPTARGLEDIMLENAPDEMVNNAMYWSNQEFELLQAGKTVEASIARKLADIAANRLPARPFDIHAAAKGEIGEAIPGVDQPIPPAQQPNLLPMEIGGLSQQTRLANIANVREPLDIEDPRFEREGPEQPMLLDDNRDSIIRDFLQKQDATPPEMRDLSTYTPDQMAPTKEGRRQFSGGKQPPDTAEDWHELSPLDMYRRAHDILARAKADPQSITDAERIEYGEIVRFIKEHPEITDMVNKEINAVNAARQAPQRGFPNGGGWEGAVHVNPNLIANYRLPNGEIIKIKEELARGARTIDHEMPGTPATKPGEWGKRGEVVKATRVSGQFDVENGKIVERFEGEPTKPVLTEAQIYKKYAYLQDMSKIELWDRWQNAPTHDEMFAIGDLFEQHPEWMADVRRELFRRHHPNESRVIVERVQNMSEEELQLRDTQLEAKKPQGLTSEEQIEQRAIRDILYEAQGQERTSLADDYDKLLSLRESYPDTNSPERQAIEERIKEIEERLWPKEKPTWPKSATEMLKERLDKDVSRIQELREQYPNADENKLFSIMQMEKQIARLQKDPNKEGQVQRLTTRLMKKYAELDEGGPRRMAYPRPNQAPPPNQPLTPAEQQALTEQRQNYASLIPAIGNRHVIWDRNQIFDYMEMYQIEHNPVLKDLAPIMKSILDELHTLFPNPGELAGKTVKYGFNVDHPGMGGVSFDSGTTQPPNLQIATLVNIFDGLFSPFRGTLYSFHPEEAARRIVHLIKHEFAHNIALTEGADFTWTASHVDTRFPRTQHYEAEVLKTLTGGTDQYAPALQDLIQVYNAAAGRINAQRNTGTQPGTGSPLTGGGGARFSRSNGPDGAGTFRAAQWEVVPPGSAPPRPPPPPTPPNTPPPPTTPPNTPTPPPPPTPAGSGQGFFRQMYELSRGLLTTLDISATLRQALPLAGTKNWFKAWDDMVKSGFSQQAYDAVMDRIKTHDLGRRQVDVRTGRVEKSILERAGLAITDLGDNLSQREEHMRSTVLEKLGFVRASNRAYNAFLNDLRFNQFKDLMETAKAQFDARMEGARNPYDDIAFARQIAEMVNTATGRGSLGRFEQNAKLLTDVFFSPRLFASRMRMLNPATYVMADPFVRKQYLYAALRTAGAWTAFAGVASMFGAEVSLDTNSADFGKIKIGDTRLDPAGGFQQYLVALSRLVTGQTTSSGTKREFELGAGYRAETRKDVAETFFVNKMHPVMKFGYDLLNASQYKPVYMGDRLAQMFIPLIIQDVTELMQQDEKLLLAIPPIAMGMGTQTYAAGETESRFLPQESDYRFEGGSFGEVPPTPTDNPFGSPTGGGSNPFGW